MPRAKKAVTPPDASPTTPAVRQKYARVTGRDRIKLVASMKREYKTGKSISAVAAEHGVSYGFAQRELSNAGVATRSRGGSKPKAKKS